MAISEKLVTSLNNLLMLDHDAVDAYQQAIDRISLPQVKKSLTEFQNDHRRHIVNLKECISRYGAKPSDRRDVKGFFIAGMTAIQSMFGNEQAIKAMKTNEMLTNKKYRECLEDLALPEDVRTIVEGNYADEKRHLAYIEDCIARQVWETGEARI